VSDIIDFKFRERLHEDPPRPDDHRDPYERDKARVIHSAAFRRLQGKTQVMGVGEGDFHRTRLTHSIEAGQIGEGLIIALRHQHHEDTKILSWLPTNALMIAACYAHDLGHPPYGHAGERALQSRMFGRGGFESNAQTLRILTKLETFRHHQGINPTRRTMLAAFMHEGRRV
jgi:dGTPase